MWPNKGYAIKHKTKDDSILKVFCHLLETKGLLQDCDSQVKHNPGSKGTGGWGSCMSRNGTAGFNLSDLDGEALKST